jgi:hypothetical protein
MSDLSSYRNSFQIIGLMFFALTSRVRRGVTSVTKAGGRPLVVSYLSNLRDWFGMYLSKGAKSLERLFFDAKPGTVVGFGKYSLRVLKYRLNVFSLRIMTATPSKKVSVFTFREYLLKASFNVRVG